MIDNDYSNDPSRGEAFGAALTGLVLQQRWNYRRDAGLPVDGVDTAYMGLTWLWHLIVTLVVLAALYGVVNVLSGHALSVERKPHTIDHAACRSAGWVVVRSTEPVTAGDERCYDLRWYTSRGLPGLPKGTVLVP